MSAILDAHTRRQGRSRSATCRKGHAFTQANTLTRTRYCDGKVMRIDRYCKKCYLERRARQANEARLPCRHCGNNISQRYPHGLCNTCRQKPELRERYMPPPRLCSECGRHLQPQRSWTEPRCAECIRGETDPHLLEIHRLSLTADVGPTEAMPGSAMRAAVYAVRVERGLPVFDRRDGGRERVA